MYTTNILYILYIYNDTCAWTPNCVFVGDHCYIYLHFRKHAAILAFRHLGYCWLR